MKKVNVLIVIWDHLLTLYDDASGKFSFWDFAFFFLLPVVLGIAFYFHPFHIPTEINGALIAVFSVFAALLFSAQMALYGLSPRKPVESKDETSRAREEERFRRDRKFFADVNYNVSYLILLSCISLLVFVAMMITNLPEQLEGSVLVVLVSHFFLTLLMLVKRTHIAFSSKYQA